MGDYLHCIFFFNQYTRMYNTSHCWVCYYNLSFIFVSYNFVLAEHAIEKIPWSMPNLFARGLKRPFRVNIILFFSLVF